MLNRLTVSSLIQSVIVLMATCMTALLCVSAWNSWERLTMTGRISVVTDASSNLFKAMHNLRSDRSTTNRSLNDEVALSPEMQKYLRDTRDPELPAMRSAAGVLASIEFPDQKTLLPELNRLIQAFAALEAETWDAVGKPKASRRPALGKEFMDNTAALLETLDKISTRIAAAVNHNDPVIDEMLMIKQLAWLMRNTAGEASLLVSNGIASGHVAPDLRQAYTKLVGGIEISVGCAAGRGSGKRVARGPRRGDGRSENRVFRPAVSCTSGSIGERPADGRETRNEGQRVEPALGRTHDRSGEGRRTRA